MQPLIKCISAPETMRGLCRLSAVVVAGLIAGLAFDLRAADAAKLIQKRSAVRLGTLRQRSSLSVRQLAAKASVSPAMVSYVERGRTAIRLVTLEKILSALGTDLGRFFGEQARGGDGPVFHREGMPFAADADRSYTFKRTNAPELRSW